MTNNLKEVTNFLPILWKLVDKLGCSANMFKFGEQYHVTLLISKNKRQFFVDKDFNHLRKQVERFAKTC